jgi:ABC-type transport system substrate-binding protein
MPAQLSAETVLRVGMTAADIPLTSGNPDQGFEGFRFMGYMLYDSLILWDLTSADKASGLVPGLATGWNVDPQDPKRWIFKLREGAKFHDGSLFNADAVVWNFEKVKDRTAAHYDPRQAALIAQRIPNIAGATKIDENTVAIVTDVPTAFLPYQVAYWLMSSPARFRETGSWDAFARNPSGTGPWRMRSLRPKERATLERNADYWDKTRIAQSDTVELLPIPDALTRSAALLNGQVDWIEAPAPDAVPQLRAAGMQISSGSYPHIWPITPSRADGSPWAELDVRKAANLCIDREAIKSLLGGLAMPAQGFVDAGHPWFGKPSFMASYEPDKARALMAAHGYGPSKPLIVKIAISTAGSGQMQPLPMFEFIQSTLNDCYFKVEAAVTEWNALLTLSRQGANTPDIAKTGINAVIISRPYMDPFSSFVRLFAKESFPPNGANWGMVNETRYNELLTRAQNSFVPAEQNAILAELHTAIVDNAEMLWVVHDVDPRALSPKVRGFIQARSWFQDLTRVTVQR